MRGESKGGKVSPPFGKGGGGGFDKIISNSLKEEDNREGTDGRTV